MTSSQSSVDNILCENLLDSSAPTHTSQLSQSLSTINGTCDAELADTDVKGSNISFTEAADPAPYQDQERPKDFCLSSHLPVELTGLSHSDITLLWSSHSMDLSACHVQKEDTLVLVVFIYNCSSSNIKQMRFELDSDELEVIIEHPSGD